jgi:hypothetical protein
LIRLRALEEEPPLNGVEVKDFGAIKTSIFPKENTQPEGLL